MLGKSKQWLLDQETDITFEEKIGRVSYIICIDTWQIEKLQAA